MSKQKSTFICVNCNYQTLKWIGCCPECSEFGTLEETVVAPSIPGTTKASAGPTTLQPLSAVTVTQSQRMCAGISEWDRVMGSGIMPSSLIVLTGDPGIGKSTLLLQVCHKLAQNYTVFYFSTEESLAQVRQRFDRLNYPLHNSFLFSDSADLNAIIAAVQQHKPHILVIDSIQNCFISGSSSLPGSVSQLREATFRLMRLAKEEGITVIVTGHINKEGVIAGPKTMEHMVDAVFYLQGDDRWQTRILRAVKNRFGTINELGFFEMTEHGLQEVANINQHLVSQLTHAPGSVLISVVEGSRALLLELQALTILSKLTMPQRVVSGVDHKQVVLIAAILEKYLQVKLSQHDIFFKVSGGIKAKETTTDLGIALALLSSYFQQPLPEKSIALGEISLTGQIKPINQINLFIKEAEKFGVTELLVAKSQKVEKTNCSVLKYQNVYELLSIFKG